MLIKAGNQGKYPSVSTIFTSDKQPMIFEKLLLNVFTEAKYPPINSTFLSVTNINYIPVFTVRYHNNIIV